MLIPIASLGIPNQDNGMRTTLDIPEELIEEALRILGFKSKTDAVILSLRELIRRQRIEDLKQLLGTIELDVNIPNSRRRPGRIRRQAWSAVDRSTGWILMASMA